MVLFSISSTALGIPPDGKKSLLSHKLAQRANKNIEAASDLGIIAVWNSLPTDVAYVDSTNIFVNHMDNFWYNQDPKFDCNADITVIGSRSLKCS